jgi:intergrase/recombinase
MNTRASTERVKRKRLPAYVVKQYEGGARGFKKLKREQLKALDRLYTDLRTGCAFFPGDGYRQMDVIEKALNRLIDLLSEKGWGR